MKIKTTKKCATTKVVTKKAAKPVAKAVTFTFHADKGKAVYVAGEFNKWNPTAKKMAYKAKDGITPPPSSSSPASISTSSSSTAPGASIRRTSTRSRTTRARSTPSSSSSKTSEEKPKQRAAEISVALSFLE